MTGITTTANIAVGMAVTGTNAGAGAVVSAIVSNTALTLSVSSTGLASATFTADSFKIALIIASPAGTYGAASTNYSQLGTDELATAGGYTRPGLLLVNANPNLTNPVTTAATSFTSPSWTSSTFTTTGDMIYNTSARLGGTASTGRAICINDFAGSQVVTSSTFTLTAPVQDGTTGLIRV